jgi:hypothetical protein
MVWRVLQIAALLLVVVCFWKVSRNFRIQHVQAPVTQRDVFLNYVNVMNLAHETVAAVLNESDTSNVDPTVRTLEAVPAPDPQADELRKRLIALLGKSTTQVAASPSPSTAPRRAPKLDEKLLSEFEAWNNDYNAWLKSKVNTFNQ